MRLYFGDALTCLAASFLYFQKEMISVTETNFLFGKPALLKIA